MNERKNSLLDQLLTISVSETEQKFVNKALEPIEFIELIEFVSRIFLDSFTLRIIFAVGENNDKKTASHICI